MGVLIPHFLDAGVKPENVVGCDLSTQMLAEARRRHPAVTFWQGDFAELPADLGRFDAVFFNACFGNFFEQAATVNNASALLTPAGRIVISHPMGNRFVIELKSRDPKLVLHPLPPKHELDKWCENFNLRLETFRDEPDLYVAVLQSLLAERNRSGQGVI
jgi:ubiquinone/menaquinone biosynthesis C-methylase UbiE